MFCYITNEDLRIEMLFNDFAVIWPNNCNSHHYYTAIDLYNILIIMSIHVTSPFQVVNDYQVGGASELEQICSHLLPRVCR